MKKGKKWLALMLAGVMSLSVLTGCGGDTSQDSSTQEST